MFSSAEGDSDKKLIGLIEIFRVFLQSVYTNARFGSRLLPFKSSRTGAVSMGSDDIANAPHPNEHTHGVAKQHGAVCRNVI